MNPYYEHGGITIYHGDALAVLRELPAESVNCCVTSPPYWGLRDYGVSGQMGLESTPDEFIARMVEVFAEVRRVLRDDGTCWINIGDSYANDGKWGGETGGKQAYLDASNRKRVGREKRMTGLKPKDLVGIPWMLAFALRADGWYLRQDIIWHKPNPMPESVRDRCTKAHEYVFLLSKSERYFYDRNAIRTPFSEETKQLSYDTMDYSRRDNYATPVAGWKTGQTSHRTLDHAIPSSHKGSKFTTGKTAATKPAEGQGDRKDSSAGANKRSVWTIATEGFPEAHFATFPTELVKPCVLAGCPAGGVVLDPFAGSGTTLAVARSLQCLGVGIELKAEYIEIAIRRLDQDVLDFSQDTSPK